MTALTKNICRIAGAALLILAGGCAKEPASTKNDSNKRFVDAWVSVNHPQAVEKGLGIFILDDRPGTGGTVSPEDSYYVFVSTTVTDLEGNVTSTSSKTLSQQIGTFSQSNYYGPTFIMYDRNYISTGLYEMLDGMRVGGTRTALIPGWLNVVNDYSTAEEYLKNCSGDNAICTITVEDKTSDVAQWEIQSLEKFAASAMAGTDSTFFGYYSRQLVAPKDTSAMPRDTSFYINYTGRLLSGQVFDTTIKDTAKVHGIYSPGRDYSPKKVTLNEDYQSITLGDSSGEGTGSKVVNGFAYCLSELRRYEKRICAFQSSLGYGYSGSGEAIPSFSPICFEIEMVEKPE